MPVSGSTYPDRGGYGFGYAVNASRPLVNLSGFTGQPDSMTPATTATEDPAARTGAVLQMMPWWQPMNINVEGTECIKRYAEYIIPREPREDDEAYNRRMFTLFCLPLFNVSRAKLPERFLGGASMLREAIRNIGTNGVRTLPATGPH